MFVETHDLTSGGQNEESPQYNESYCEINRWTRHNKQQRLCSSPGFFSQTAWKVQQEETGRATVSTNQGGSRGRQGQRSQRDHLNEMFAV